jgi:uncharacterized protein (TIGR02246 family)
VWGHGLATEIARAVLQDARTLLGMPVVRASTDAPNAASIRVLERLGFRVERQGVVAGVDTVFFRFDESATHMHAQENVMPADPAPSDRAAFERIVGQLEAGWNAMDGSAFAAPFAGDADFVNIRGEHFRGRNAIAAGHAEIFRTIYAGSTNQYTVESARLLRPEAALVHVRAVLDVPQGPLAGRHRACFSLVLTKESSGWEIAALHNTLEAAKGPPR